MTAVTYNIVVEQGATYNAVFEWRTDDGSNPPTGALISTTGYAAHMQIRSTPGGDALATLAEGTGLTTSGGVITVRIGADVTALITRSGEYDLELHSLSDPTEVIRLAQGRVTLAAERTKT